jgi:hypothetical protein
MQASQNTERRKALTTGIHLCGLLGSEGQSMSERPWLSEEEMIDLTGYRMPSKQEQWCLEKRIKCWRNGLGRVRIPRDAVSGMLPGATANKRPLPGPDLTNIR